MRLHLKFILLVAALSFAIGGMSALLVSQIMREALERELKAKGMVIAQTLAERVTLSVINGEIIPVRETLQEIVRRTKNVDYAYVTGFDNEILAHSFERGFPRELLSDHDDPKLIRADALLLDRYRTQRGPVLQVGYPLIDGMRAHLHIGLNESSALYQLRKIRTQIIVTTLGIALLAALLGIVLSRRITRPLMRLSESMRAFGEGKMETEIDTGGGGREVVELTQSFKRMVTERKQVEAALRFERNKVINILDSMEDGVYIVNRQYDIEYVNPVLKEEFGVVEGRKCYEYFHDRKEVCPWCKNPEVFAGKNVRWEWYSPKNQKTYDLIDTPLKNLDGSIISKLEIFRDISELKQAEEGLLRINRALKMLSKCNQAVVRAREEPHLLHEICKIIVDIGGYRLAWVGFAEQDEAKTVRPAAQAGYEEGYLDTLNITWTDTERGRGPTGTAIRAGKPIVIKDILTDPNFTPWRSEARKRGYESAIALPLNADPRVLGALNIYAAEPDAFDAEEVKLLMELADNLAYGIMALRTQAERKRVDEELEKHRERLEELVKERTSELKEKNAELERMNEVFTGREFRIKELRDKVKELELKIDN